MAKLIVISIILAFFGAVLLVVQMNYRREMRDRETRLPTLDDQLDTLVRAGLPLTPGVTRATLLDWGPEDRYGHEPWRLLLLTLASAGEDGKPLSPRATMIDTSGPVPRADLARITGHTPTSDDLETSLAECARMLPANTGLYTMDNGTDRAVFVLPNPGSARITAVLPDLQKV